MWPWPDPRSRPVELLKFQKLPKTALGFISALPAARSVWLSLPVGRNKPCRRRRWPSAPLAGLPGLLDNIYAQPLSKSSGLLFGLEPSTSYFILSSPNQCLVFATHPHTIAAYFAVVPGLYHLFIGCVNIPLMCPEICPNWECHVTSFMQLIVFKVVCCWWQGVERDEILKHVQMSVSCTRLLIHKLQTLHVSNDHVSLTLSHLATRSSDCIL